MANISTAAAKSLPSPDVITAGDGVDGGLLIGDADLRLSFQGLHLSDSLGVDGDFVDIFEDTNNIGTVYVTDASTNLGALDVLSNSEGTVGKERLDFEKVRNSNLLLRVFNKQGGMNGIKKIEQDIRSILEVSGGSHEMLNAVSRYFASVISNVIWSNESSKISSSDRAVVKRIEIKTFTKREDDLSDPKRAAAIDKLLSFKDKVDYQKTKGRAAIPVDTWLSTTFVETGRLSSDELALIPMWAYRQFNSRLYQALLDKKRTQPR